MPSPKKPKKIPRKKKSRTAESLAPPPPEKKIEAAPAVEVPAVLPGDEVRTGKGRRPKLTRKLFEKIMTAYALGATDEQVAEMFELNPDTIYAWKKHPYFSEAATRAKAGVDEKVEGMLLKRALGFEFAETTMERIVDKNAPPDTAEKMVATKIVRRHIPPDVNAQIFWLKNRKPKTWREKEDSGPPQIASITINNVVVQGGAPLPAPANGNGNGHEKTVELVP